MHFEEGQTVGIDLGTTFSSIAQLDEKGNPVAIPNEDDEIETASLILLAESGHVIVGANRMRAAVEDPDNVVERIKRHMGDVQYKRTFDGRPITRDEFTEAYRETRLMYLFRYGDWPDRNAQRFGFENPSIVICGPLPPDAVCTVTVARPIQRWTILRVRWMSWMRRYVK